MKVIEIQPLTRVAFFPFGEVIEMEGAYNYPINAGKCVRYHDLAKVETTGEKARAMISLLRGEPYRLPLELKMVERHPLGSQAFIPLTDNPFLTKPGQGVNIGRNVWHGILTPLDGVSDFAVVDRGGEGVNLEEHFFAEPFLIR
jgi:ureidoglycolate lyase